MSDQPWWNWPLFTTVVTFIGALALGAFTYFRTKFVGEALAKLGFLHTRQAEHFKLRTEREFHVLEELWPILAELNDAVLTLRPESSKSDSSVSKEERIAAKKERWMKAIHEAYHFIRDREPFLSPEILKIWHHYDKAVRKEYIEFDMDKRHEKGLGHLPDDYWQRAEKNRPVIDELLDRMLAQVRKEISEMKPPAGESKIVESRN